MIKQIISYDFKLHNAKGTQYLFPFKWCINKTIVSVADNKLHFHI